MKQKNTITLLYTSNYDTIIFFGVSFFFTFANTIIHTKSVFTIALVRPFKVIADLFISTYGFIITFIDILRTIYPYPARFTDTPSHWVTSVHTLSTGAYLAAVFAEIWFFTLCVRSILRKMKYTPQGKTFNWFK